MHLLGNSRKKEKIMAATSESVRRLEKAKKNDSGNCWIWKRSEINGCEQEYVQEQMELKGFNVFELMEKSSKGECHKIFDHLFCARKIYLGLIRIGKH